MTESTKKPWEFAGWGRAELINDIPSDQEHCQPLDETVKHKLGKWSSTAICGNDITSSCLYVSALCAVHAGHLAPVVLIIVAAVLFLFRKVYAEVGSALPMNGGTYTVLLNTANKKLAAAAACLTILSYIATAVISAGEAMHYAHNLIHGLNIGWATIGLLGFFAILNLIGIGESAIIALIIFILHIVTLTVLSIAAIITIAKDPSMLTFNWSTPTPNGVLHALFFGFAAAMLGISGFESSANFIEEQKEGVFPKTLNNMWLAVAIFNPLISILSLGLLPMITIQGGVPQALLDQLATVNGVTPDLISSLAAVTNGVPPALIEQLSNIQGIPADLLSQITSIQGIPADLLAQMGTLSAGQWLGTIVSIDAVLVLSGAVLTSYVGVTGLIRRMTLDRCMPQFLLAQNKLRKTNHWIILAFFVLCWSIYIITGGKITTLAGVYTLSFLCVMGLFAIGNMLLKSERAKLPRDTYASWPMVTVALFAIIVGIAGNVILDPKYVAVFSEYYIAIGIIVAVMFLRIQLLKIALFIIESILEKIKKYSIWTYGAIVSYIEKINSITVVYFTKDDGLESLNKAALYVQANEQTNILKVVHVTEDINSIPPLMAEHLNTIDRIYPSLRIDFIAVEGKFGPNLIESLSHKLKVPKNLMFISTPGTNFCHKIEELGGVRLVL